MKNASPSHPLDDDDQQVFDDLYLKYHDCVYAICFRMTRNVSDSEDLTQDVFIKLFRTIKSFRGESAFTTWLHRLTVNQVLMHFRKRKRRAELAIENGEIPAHFEQMNQGHNRLRAVDRILLSEVITKLPEGYRQAIVLHDIEGLGHREIASRSGRSIGTSKSQLHKGRARLRELINGPRPRMNMQSIASSV